MNHDISQPVPQGSDGAQDAENSRITAIADELERLCAVHEAQCGDSQQNVSRFETEQRAAEQMAKSQGFWIPFPSTILICFTSLWEQRPLVHLPLGHKAIKRDYPFRIQSRLQEPSVFLGVKR